MKRTLLAPAALALLLGATAGARADLVTPSNVEWSYNFTPARPVVYADDTESSGVTFTNEPTDLAQGTTDVVATNLRVFSAASRGNPDSITDGAYALNLTLSTTEDGVVNTKTLTFTGRLDGDISAGSSNLTSEQDKAIQSVSLGSFNFTVALTSFTPPGPPNQELAGSISAKVTVSTLTPTQDAPEPSTMLLSGLGLTFLGGAAWRKRRAKAA